MAVKCQHQMVCGGEAPPARCRRWKVVLMAKRRRQRRAGLRAKGRWCLVAAGEVGQQAQLQLQ